MNNDISKTDTTISNLNLFSFNERLDLSQKNEIDYSNQTQEFTNFNTARTNFCAYLLRNDLTIKHALQIYAKNSVSSQDNNLIKKLAPFFSNITSAQELHKRIKQLERLLTRNELAWAKLESTNSTTTKLNPSTLALNIQKNTEKATQLLEQLGFVSENYTKHYFQIYRNIFSRLSINQQAPLLSDSQKLVKVYQNLFHLSEKDLTRYLTNLVTLYSDYSETRNIIVNNNIKLVYQIANKISKQNNNLLDSIQNGILGLMEAIERFEPERGIQFSTYATQWIRKEILQGHDKQVSLISLRKSIAHFNIIRQQLSEQLGHTVSNEELGKHLHLRINTIQQLSKPVPQTILKSDLSFYERHHKNSIIERSDLKKEILVEPETIINTLKAAIEDIRHEYCKQTNDERGRNCDIFIEYFGLNDLNNKPTYEEIASKYGISFRRISQIIQGMKKRVQRKLIEDYPEFLESFEDFEDLIGSGDSRKK